MLNIIGVVTLVVRYKAQAGRLLQVVRRDGSIYYLSVLGSFPPLSLIHAIYIRNSWTSSYQTRLRNYSFVCIAPGKPEIIG